MAFTDIKEILLRGISLLYRSYMITTFSLIVLSVYGMIVNHDIAPGKIDFLRFFLLERSFVVEVGVGEIAFEVAAVLILHFEVNAWRAVAACSQSFLSIGNAGKVFSKLVAPDRSI